MYISYFYHEYTLWNVLGQKWRNKQATTTMWIINEIYQYI